MRALGVQGLQIVRQAAEATATDVIGESQQPPNLPKKRVREPRKPRVAAPLALPASSVPVFDREALRRKLEAASIRPVPGTSELLKHVLRTELVFGYTEGGKLTNDAECHDLMALAPIHLKKKEE